MKATEALTDQGLFELGGVLDPTDCAALLSRIERSRSFDESLFLTQDEFDADPQFTGVNPMPGRNLLEALSDESSFVETAPEIVESLTELLGEGYETINKKVVCGVPESHVPGWVRSRILGNAVNNLGAYVRPEYRDITYFYGIDFHQDIIDWKDRTADFVTLYVYLSEVGPNDAPLYVLPKSHRFGATIFPHKLERLGAGKWRYQGDNGLSAELQERALLGSAGHVAMWHSATLHGTMPTTADRQRLSLRYLYAKAPGARAGIDDVNAALQGPLCLASTRVDLAPDGSAAIKVNAINQGRAP